MSKLPHYTRYDLGDMHVNECIGAVLYEERGKATMTASTKTLALARIGERWLSNYKLLPTGTLTDLSGKLLEDSIRPDITVLWWISRYKSLTFEYLVQLGLKERKSKAKGRKPWIGKL